MPNPILAETPPACMHKSSLVFVIPVDSELCRGLTNLSRRLIRREGEAKMTDPGRP